MFWNDIAEIKEEFICLKNSILQIEQFLFENELSIKKTESNKISYEDCVNNVDKLNSVINEFKGCVSMARGALEERRKLDGSKYESIVAEETLSKIDYIYYNMTKFAEFMQNHEKKSRKKGKFVKKKKKKKKAALEIVEGLESE